MATRTALVIEDDASCSDLLELILSSIPDLCVHTARSGSQARRRLATGHLYALIITDFHLPGEDGLTLIEELRSAPGRGALPFVVVTSSADAQVRHRAEAMGASGFFEKPFSPARLREAVNSILNGP